MARPARLELTDSDARMRHELGVLYSDVSVELRRRRQPPRRVPRRMPMPGILKQLEREMPTLALQYVGELSLLLRRLTGRDVIDLAAVMEMAQFIYRQRELARRGPNFQIDEFGFDEEWTESLLPVFRWIYHRYWRVETTGLENVPSQGRALLVSNHAGVLPWDGAMIKKALMDEHPSPRHARALVASFFFTLPMLSWFLRRTGQTVGHPDDSLRLLEQDHLVLVFPEGVKGTGKPWRERYRLRRFGRGGFVQTAIRGAAPIIPISVVGSEEIYPMLGDLAPIARLGGFPYFPVTPFWPWLGVLGMIPLPTKWRIQFHEPIPTHRLDLEAADDQNLVMTISDQVRDTIQQGLYENLRLRRGVFY